MVSKRELTPDLLRQCLDYDPQTGAFTWKERHVASSVSPSACKTWNTRFAGKPALFTDNGAGYLQGRVYGRTIKAHRAAWMIHYGVKPKCDLDHIDGNGTNNAIANLREASDGLNNANRRAYGAVRYVGVWMHAGGYKAQVFKDGKAVWRGRFKTAEEAAKRRDEAARQFYGPNVVCNFPVGEARA